MIVRATQTIAQGQLSIDMYILCLYAQKTIEFNAQYNKFIL